MKRPDRGFTLIEVILSTSILGAFLSFTFGSMLSMFTASAAGIAVTDAASENQRALQKINRDLLQSTLDRVSSTSNSITLQKVIGFDDVAGLEVWSGTIVYSLNPQSQLIRTDNGIPTVVANGVIQFSVLQSVTNLLVSLTTTQGNSNKNTDSQVNYTLTIYPKN